MIYLPPHTVKEKVAALRSCLPGVNLYNFLKGMPTALGRRKETVPRGMSQLREVSTPSSVDPRPPHVCTYVCSRVSSIGGPSLPFAPFRFRPSGISQPLFSEDTLPYHCSSRSRSLGETYESNPP